jgi:hypothetical protein
MHSNLQTSPWRTQRALPSRLPCGDGCVAQYLFVVYLAARLHPARPGLLSQHGGAREPSGRREKAKMSKIAGNQSPGTPRPS